MTWKSHQQLGDGLHLAAIVLSTVAFAGPVKATLTFADGKLSVAG